MASTSALDGPWGPVRRRVGENSQRYLRVRRARWNSRIVDGLSTIRAHEQCTHAGEDPIRRAEIRRPVPRAIQNEQLLLDQDRFSHDRPQAARAHQPGQGGDQVHQQDDRVAHRNILATTPRITKLDNLNGLRAE